MFLPVCNRLILRALLQVMYAKVTDSGHSKVTTCEPQTGLDWAIMLLKFSCQPQNITKDIDLPVFYK